MSQMFCFQCQQTAGNKCCVQTGVCGKQPETANLQDELVCGLIRLAETAGQQGARTEEISRLLIDGLFTTLTNVNFDDEAIRHFIRRVESERKKLGGQDKGTLELWRGETDIVSLRSTLLFGMKGMAAYAHHALNLGFQDEQVTEWFYKGLSALRQERSSRRLAGADYGVRAGQLPLHGTAGSGQHGDLRRPRPHQSALWTFEKARSSWCPAMIWKTCISCWNRRRTGGSTFIPIVKCCPPTAIPI